jgi:hypothetical protein
MTVPAFLNTIEQTPFSVWIRESESVFAYYFILVFHTIGLSLLVGTSALVALRLLGVAPALPLPPLKKLFPLIWGGLWLNITSGMLLLFAYPTKALTNPIFYLKLALVGFAVRVMMDIERRFLGSSSDVDPDMMAKARWVAMGSLLLWCAVIGTGRLLAYTSSYILYGKIM